MSQKRKIIFTDLDGTMIDAYTGSYKKSLPGIKLVKKKKIPIVFCSSKTRVEQEVLRKETGINDPFIVENGSAICVPKGYFSFSAGEPKNGYEVIELGVSYEKIKNRINELRKRYEIVGYAILSAEEVAKITGLGIELAKLAKRREYTETLTEVSTEAVEELKKNFNVVFGGRFIEVMGKNADKGKAVRILTELFKREFGEVETYGIGNSKNDGPMLRAVDHAYLVKNPDGSWEDGDAKKIDGIGPEGWKMAIKEICS